MDHEGEAARVINGTGNDFKAGIRQQAVALIFLCKILISREVNLIYHQMPCFLTRIQHHLL